MSPIYPVQCSSLKINDYIMIKNRPCLIAEMSTSKTGKHGHAKVHFVAHDIFSGEKYEDICPSTHNMAVPHVSRKDYQLVNVEDGFAELMDDDGRGQPLVKLGPGNSSAEINVKHAEILEKFNGNEAVFVTLMTACEDMMIVGLKV